MASAAWQCIWLEALPLRDTHSMTLWNNDIVVTNSSICNYLDIYIVKPTRQTQRRSLQGMALHLGSKMMLRSFFLLQMQAV